MRKRRDESAATLLTGTERAAAPFFSPDGRWVGYRTPDGKLKKVPVDGGGGSVTLADDADAINSAAAWLDDGTIVYGARAGLNRINATGGTAHRVERNNFV